MAIYLHEHKEFPDLLALIGEEMGIDPGLVEKDYWIMHCLYGLQQQGYVFQLKGGTSLSKGFGLIDRFSEDIDMHIEPPAKLEINSNPNNDNKENIEKKRLYYDQLVDEIQITGIIKKERDFAFDDKKKYNSGGIRLHYQKIKEGVPGLKEGILLEAGYAQMAPNVPKTITSWAYEKAKNNGKIEIVDNRAIDVPCYDHRYTFIEKLQSIATKFRKEEETNQEAQNFMRQYYDVYCLLADEEVVKFIGTNDYLAHKKKHFPSTDYKIPINENQAFLLSDAATRERYEKRYLDTKALYYKGQPPFDEILKRISGVVDKL